MAFYINENGDISLVQGDSGKIFVEGIDTDKNYTVYFAIQDSKRNPVGNELFVSSNGSDRVTFELTGSFTDLLTVEKNKPYSIYYYGIKVCNSANNIENTLVIGSNDIGYNNVIIVYPKKVEGI